MVIRKAIVMLLEDSSKYEKTEDLGAKLLAYLSIFRGVPQFFSVYDSVWHLKHAR